MSIDLMTELESLVDFFSDCRREGFDRNAAAKARRFLLLDRELAREESGRPVFADVCGRRVQLPPIPDERVHPANRELFGVTEERDDEALENRVSINLRAAVARVYLSECAAASPDRDFLAFIRTYLHFCVFKTLAWAVAYEDADDCCLPCGALLACLNDLADKEGSPEARACFALAAFARRGAPDCPADYPAKAAALIADGDARTFFEDELLLNLGDDALRRRIGRIANEEQRLS